MCEHSELVAEMAIVEQLPAQDRLKHAHRRRLRQIQTWTCYDEKYGVAEIDDPSADAGTADAPDVKHVTDPGGNRTGYYYYSNDEDQQSPRVSAVSESSSHYPDVVNSALSCLANGGASKELKRSRKSKRAGVKFVPGIVLLEAASRNDLQEVRQLLESGIDPNVCNADGLTALHQCCIDDYYDMVQLLLAHGAEINACDTELWTPLHAAATCGHANLIKLFADRGADLLALNADGNMPYDMCEDEIALDVLEAEMSNRGITQEDIDLARALPEKEMLIDMKKLAEIGTDLLETRDSRGATPLHIASANGYISVVEFLLDKKVIIDGQDNDLWTPLHGAAYWGHPMVIEALIAKGADIDAKNKDGETPIEICEDPDIKERLMDIKTELEQSKLLQPIWLHPNSRTSTRRTSSIRRSSIRDKSALSRREMVEEAKMRQTPNPLTPPIASPRKMKNKKPIPKNVASIDSDVMDPEQSLPSILIENVQDGETDNCQEEIAMSPQITRVDDARMIVPLASVKSGIRDPFTKNSDCSSPLQSPSWNHEISTAIASSPFPNKGILKSGAGKTHSFDLTGTNVTNRRTTITPSPRVSPRGDKGKSSISGISNSWATLKTLRHLGFKLTNPSSMGNKGMVITQNKAVGSEKCLLPELKRVRKLHNEYKLSNKFGKVFSDKTSLLCASTSSLHPAPGSLTLSTPIQDRKLGLARSMPSLINHGPPKATLIDNIDSNAKDQPPDIHFNALSLSVRTVGSKKDIKLNQERKESLSPRNNSTQEIKKGPLENGSSSYTVHKEKFQANKECCVIA